MPQIFIVVWMEQSQSLVHSKYTWTEGQSKTSPASSSDSRDQWL